MSNENKPKDVASTEAAAEGEINEEQLESVAGGILIGLRQPAAHKDLTAGHKDLVGQLDSQLGKKGNDAYVIKFDGSR